MQERNFKEAVAAASAGNELLVQARVKRGYQPPPGVKPGAWDKAGAGWYVGGLSESTIERGVREEWFPAPRELSPGRVGWLTADLDSYLASRPKSSMLPPPNTGHRNRRGVNEAG